MTHPDSCGLSLLNTSVYTSTETLETLLLISTMLRGLVGFQIEITFLSSICRITNILDLKYLKKSDYYFSLHFFLFVCVF